MDYKKCMFCGEEISIELRRCPYCGSLLRNISETVEMDKISGNNDSYVLAGGEKQEGEVAQLCIIESEDGSIDIRVFENKQLAGLPDEMEKIQVNGTEKQQGLLNSNKGGVAPLGNGLKVFLTILSTVVPGLGQLIGVITAVVFINSEDRDRNSFGIALMVSSLIFFIISCLILLFCVIMTVDR